MARTQRRRAVTPAATTGAATEATATTRPAEAAPRPRRVSTNLPRPAATPLAAPGAPAAKPRRSPFAFFKKLQPGWVADIIAELKKVTWPGFTETRYLTFVVVIVAMAVGFLLGGVDVIFGWFIEKLFFS